ncbi:Lacal_2735 family protein [Psychroserpens jangbogonensis]|uniref:Lacal_2735 family protein n=1 Tax=Psychroserpens jangbogonensis TaxID=1484460 RepID=UPI00053D9FCD|nr:Lacal_2735 family protein [Psychroserpens jangbogonensis]
MKYSQKIVHNQSTLLSRYKTLVEQAYNLRQTDSALSDFSEYKAIKLLHKMNKLKFLRRDLTVLQQN